MSIKLLCLIKSAISTTLLATYLYYSHTTSRLVSAWLVGTCKKHFVLNPTHPRSPKPSGLTIPIQLQLEYMWPLLSLPQLLAGSTTTNATKRIKAVIASNNHLIGILIKIIKMINC